MSKLVLKESKLREIIKESVRSILNEAMTQGFSFQKLEELTDPKDKINYCTDYLGDIIGKGSSRVVFEIDDAQVLKLAYGSMYEAGIAQNKAEWNVNRNANSPLLVRTLYHAKDWSWVVCERVVQSSKIDFFNILGMPYTSYSNYQQAEKEFNGENPDLLGYDEYRTKPLFDKSGDISFVHIKNVMNKLLQGVDLSKDFPTEYKIITTHPWFKELYRLCNDFSLDIGDISVHNMGITLRNGQPSIVILDSGLTEEVLNNYY